MFLDDNRIEEIDDRHSKGEIRYFSIGLIYGTITVVYVVYTERSDTIRIISARQANKREEEIYYDGYND